jgi:DNA-binding protein YbaB
MLDKLKQFGQLKSLHDAMQKEEFSASQEGITITVNGALNVTAVILNPALEADKAASLVKDLTNEALRQAQMSAANKLSGLGLGM